MFIKFIRKNFANIIFLIPITYSLYLGVLYSAHHIDPWHWGTIASESVDYINNFKLFKEITLMYGAGQPILFKIINTIYSVNYFSIGLITCVAYVLNLFICYVIFLRLSNKIISLLLIFCIFSLVPYPQVPWPDFYAGLCLTLSCFFMINYQKNLYKGNLYLSAIFLCISIVFRNSYIISIALSIVTYFFLILFEKEKISSHIKKILVLFFIFLLIFFLLLFFTDNLFLWYSQGIGRVGSYFNYEYNLAYNSLTLFIYRILIPTNLGDFYFLLFYLSNFIFLIFILFFNKEKNVNKEKRANLIFLSLLGLFGIIQSFNHFETWRNLNSCISIFFISAYIINNFKLIFFKKSKIILYLIIFVSFFPLIQISNYPPKYPTLTMTTIFPTFGHLEYQNIDKPKDGFKFIEFSSDVFKKNNINFFGDHVFTKENNLYYLRMKSIICKYPKIINLTMDRTLVYICDKKNNIKSTFSDVFPPIFFDDKLQKEIENDEIDDNTIILAHKDFTNSKLKLLKIEKIPKYTRYTKGSLYRSYFDNEIYIYIKQ